MAVFRITRRRLLVGAAGATAVAGGAGLWLGVQRLSNARFRQPADRGERFAPSVFLAIDAAGIVTIWLTRSEMGQGVSTALPMIVAEELDADWSRVRVEHADAGPEHDYGSQFTAASSSVTSMWTELRRAGAAARAMLVAAAAERWGVRAAACETAAGVVRHPQSEREATYGELAGDARRQRVPLRPRLRDPAAFRLIGTPLQRLDLPAKVTGEAIFGIDVRLPGMLHAVVARPPTIGGSLERLDPAPTLAVPGVRQVVRIASGVAVVAGTTYAALRGRDALDVTWQPGPHAGLSDADVTAALRAGLEGPAAVARDDGDALGVLDAAAPGELIEATYTLPYLAHAAMEPMNCTAAVAGGRCEVWAPTQSPDAARQRAARVAGLPLERVTLHKTYLGGGFGRRATDDFVAEAVEVAAQVDAPVQVLWTREDDMRHSPCREASAHRLRAVPAPDGTPAAWWHRVVTTLPGAPGPDVPVHPFAVLGASDLPYSLDAVRVEWAGADVPVPTTIWRAVAMSYNSFAVESFIDELATSAGADPLAYRLELLEESPRLRRCLERAASLAGWAPGSQDAERSLGAAVCSAFGSHVAQIAEVRRPGGAPTVTRVWCVADCGTLVNPDTVRAQLEGGILFGLSAALRGRLTLRAGSLAENGYHDYRILRIDEAPRLDVELLPSGEPPGGVGELAVPPIAPAVANAWFAATGGRVRALPLAG